MYKNITKIGQNISQCRDKDSFNFELLLGLIDAYYLGVRMSDIKKLDNKWFFYTVTISGEAQNGVLLTTYGHFNIRFLLDVAYGGEPDIVLNWWTEISRQQALEFLGTEEIERIEHEVEHGIDPEPEIKSKSTAKLRLVRDVN
jgi:hypothetical protein